MAQLLRSRFAPSWRVVRRAIVAGLLATLGCSSEPTPPRTERLPAAAGVIHRHKLASGAVDRLEVELRRGEYLEIEVLQEGIDVALSLLDPHGDLVFETDSPEGSSGNELVRFVASQGGAHALRVEPLDDNGSGTYRVAIRALREATPGDRIAAAFENAWGRGERRRFESDHPGAVVAYREALRHSTAIDPVRRAFLHWNLGESLRETGSLGPALRHLELAADTFRSLGDHLGEARALNDLGQVRRRRGELVEGAAAFERALDLYTALGIPTGRATALHNLALTREDEGRLEEAMSGYEHALRLWRSASDVRGETTTLQNLGSLYAFVGRTEEARDLLEDAERHSRALGVRDRTHALVAVGWLHYLLDDPVRALDLLERAYRLARESGNRRVEIAVLDRTATVLAARGERAEAERRYTSALDLAESSATELERALILANLGRLHLEMGEIHRARRELTRALRRIDEAADPDARASIHLSLGRIERRLERFDAAETHFRAAMAIVESLRSSLASRLWRSHLQATRSIVHEELVSLLVDQASQSGDERFVRQALEAVDRYRGRGLVEALSRPDATRAGGATRRRRAILARIGELEGERSSASEASDSEGLARLDAEIRRWSLRSEELEARPSGAAASLASSDIQGALDPETLLLVYSLGDVESYLWVVDRDSVEVHKLQGRAAIDRLAATATDLLHHSDQIHLQAALDRSLAALSRAVLGPIGGRLGSHRIVLALDGGLQQVPFGVLPRPGASREPLLVRHEIATIPSVATLIAQRRRPSPPTQGFAILADPVFRHEDDQLSTAASTGRSTRAGRDEDFDLRDLPRLRYSGEEARAIARHWTNGEPLLALRHDARRDLVISGQLAPYQLLHFATHGLLHPVRADLSGLVLTRFDREGRPVEGLLRAHEIGDLHLPADLVTLSACRTGEGEEIRWEGIEGLASAFFRADAKRLVVSYWTVSDRATAALMDRFYEHLLVERLPPAAALRAAQLEIRAQPGWSAPHYWAGFAFHGDWRPFEVH